MSGGGKGGSTTSQVQIPEWLQNAAQQNLARADAVAQLGYSPYFGPDVAAMTPMQTAALQGTNQAALSFGLPGVADPMAGMPQAQTFAGGLQGYSSAPLYQQSVDALRAAMPGQVAAIDRMFIDPITGAAPAYPFSMGGTAPAPTPGPQGFDWARAPQDSYTDRQETRRLIDAMSSRGGSGGGNFASSAIAARLPGGINTANPNSITNRMAAAVTSRPQSAPTAASRPKANPKR